MSATSVITLARSQGTEAQHYDRNGAFQGEGVAGWVSTVRQFAIFQ